MADRYGYMTVENLDVCVTAFFKMVSELDLVKIAEGDGMAIFQESVSKILHINPGMREDRLKYMIHLTWCSLIRSSRRRKSRMSMILAGTWD